MAPPTGLAVGPRLSVGAGAQCGGNTGRGGGLREPLCWLLSAAGRKERGRCAGLQCSALWGAYRLGNVGGRSVRVSVWQRGGAPGVRVRVYVLCARMRCARACEMCARVLL